MVNLFDDIVIAYISISEHIELVTSVLRCLACNGLELRLSKCKFACDQIDYLGYDITADGIRPSEDHVRSIRKYPVPQNVKQLHSYFGLCSYFRRFVPFMLLLSPFTLRKRTFNSVLMMLVNMHFTNCVTHLFSPLF